MKAGSNRTIEDRLEDIEKEVHQVKMMLTEFLGGQQKSHTEDEESLMNVKDVAKFLKVEVAVVYAACNKGEIPFLKVGKLYKFKKADVLKWVEKDKNNKILDFEGSLLTDEHTNLLTKQYGVSQKMIDSTMRTIIFNDWDHKKERKRTEIMEAFGEAEAYFNFYNAHKANQLLGKLQEKLVNTTVKQGKYSRK